jgi:hypothetical protein
MAVDERAFDDFIKANAKELGPTLVESAVGFKNKVVVANRLYMALFGDSSQDAREPGPFQGTLLLVKLQEELTNLEAARERGQQNGES